MEKSSLTALARQQLILAQNGGEVAALHIVVNGRNVEVPEHYRVHVAEKMAHLERYDDKIIRYDVELFHENNRRQSKACQRVEITGTGTGPVVRAEASGPDFYAALAAALAKLETRLRRSHDRRRGHHGRRHLTLVAEATAALATTPVADGDAQHTPSHLPDAAAADDIDGTGHGDDDGPERQREYSDVEGPGHIVRDKEHSAEPGLKALHTQPAEERAPSSSPGDQGSLAAPRDGRHWLA